MFTPRLTPTPRPPASAGEVKEVVVTARRLDAVRETIQPSLGATTYSIGDAAIKALPGGDNQALNQVVLQLPGVTQDGFGQLHIRDDHNNIQYRLNGVILPEGVSTFGQVLSPRLIQKVDLITGALPAQYGLRTAGIIDLTTKTGLFNNAGQVSVYGGSHGVLQPSAEYGGVVGDTNVFVSGSYLRSQLGIESVDGRSRPSHDRTDQGQLFAYADRTIGANDRVSFLGGYSDERFQIPDASGLQPTAGYTIGGVGGFPSQNLNEVQREVTGFAQASLLHDQGPVTLQTSLFARYSTLNYRPDAIGDLLYNGQAQLAAKTDTAFGLQSEGVYRLNDAHTLRGGVIIQGERGVSATSTEVFALDAVGAQLAGPPITIAEHGAKTQWTYSVYLQDEWKLLSDLVLNYGLRADELNGYRSEGQISPRANLLWTPLEGTAIHAGYARYFTPPPAELVGNETVALFARTSAAASNTQDTTPYSERENYYDLGVQQKVAALRGLTLGVDAYYRQSSDLLDEGQFGAPIILTPFNYKTGSIHGVELSSNYARGTWLLYGNFAYAKAQGKDIVSSQFSFTPAELAYIATHDIYLDHDQTYTGSAGVSYSFREGALNGAQVGGDLLYGSGLRSSQGAVPNGRELPSYVQVNLTASEAFDLPGVGKLSAKLDVINVADARYEIRDGTGVGVGAPQYGPRRGWFLALTKAF